MMSALVCLRFVCACVTQLYHEDARRAAVLHGNRAEPQHGRAPIAKQTHDPANDRVMWETSCERHVGTGSE